MKKISLVIGASILFSVSPAAGQSWLTETKDPNIRACQQSAFSIKVGMDERNAGMTEEQAVAKWTKLILERGGDLYELRLMVGGIKNAYKTAKIDLGLAEYIYYHCVENIR